MKILAIDTTTKFMNLGFYADGKVYEYNLEAGSRISGLLVPAIERALAALGWDIASIDYFACGIGPGSFTGVRVGLATVKSFAWALKKPVIGITSLDNIAMNALALKEEGPFVAAIDAKRDLIYCSGYWVKNGVLKRTMPYMLLTLGEFLKKIKPYSYILGDALAAHGQYIAHAFSGVRLLDKDYWFCSGRNAIELSLRRIKEKRLDSPFTLHPLYMYPKECQIKVKVSRTNNKKSSGIPPKAGKR
jgi:tRNA threonylcarbamoyladenosine biosynthesis protein TsaB